MPLPPKSPTIGIRYISDAIKSDHRLLERLHASITTPKSPTPPERHRALCRQLAWELARHVVAAELLIFPGTARRAKQGNRGALERLREMRLLREELWRFSEAVSDANAGGGGGGEKKVVATLEELGGDLGRHMRDVEKFDLVNIENVLSSRESEDMARDFERTVFFIPHGVREEDAGEDFVVEAPYKTVEGLLDASARELRAAMEKFPREEDIKPLNGAGAI